MKKSKQGILYVEKFKIEVDCMLFHPCKPSKGMSPVCAVAVTALAVAGAVSVFMLCKKKWGCLSREMKKFGCECKEAFTSDCDDSCEI
ncbi:MAG: hypothetical protein J6V82_05175 [Clostridia bacterium]|nr:hypothetical protein [Clostridia bacterium]MBO7151127.1 hypothetical protein [Clostridia bacterium]